VKSRCILPFLIAFLFGEAVAQIRINPGREFSLFSGFEKVKLHPLVGTRICLGADAGWQIPLIWDKIHIGVGLQGQVQFVGQNTFGSMQLVHSRSLFTAPSCRLEYRLKSNLRQQLSVGVGYQQSILLAQSNLWRASAVAEFPLLWSNNYGVLFAQASMYWKQHNKKQLNFFFRVGGNRGLKPTEAKAFFASSVQFGCGILSIEPPNKRHIVNSKIYRTLSGRASPD
jgi:hypothetical protein